MHLALHNWMKIEPLEASIARMAKYGYKSIEIMGEPDKYNTKDVKSLLDQHDMTCWGAVTLMLGDRNLLSANEGHRANSVQYVKDCITMVKELEGKVISIVPGTVGKVVPDSTPENEWTWAVDGMKEIYEHSESAGIRIAIEPINRFETYFINRGAQALALAEAVGPNCGVCLDVFHMNIEESDSIQTIKEIGSRLANFHIADNNRQAPLMGDLDFAELIRAAKSVGYDGALSLEFCPPFDRTPANPYPEIFDRNPEGITESERKFLEDHGSNVISTEFYDMLVDKSAQAMLPYCQGA